LAAAIRSVSRAPQMELALRYGLPTRWGSYAIAVAPKKSASGNAMLIGGPQMGFMTPQIAHEVHLVAPGLNAIGMGFGGIPGVLIGRNEHLAWSTTTGNGDETDIFVEELNPANKYQYKYKSEWKEMEKRTETIAVRGGAPVTQEVYRTVHGPVVSFDEAANRAYAQASTYWDHENDNIDAIYDLNRAQNIREFGTAAAKFTTSHNWLCATQDGDIGYWFVGRAPVRADGLDARFPTPGTGEYDWKGTRRFEEMPQIVNPKQGFLANWNNTPAVWWENSDTPVWGAIFRVQRIFDRLAEKPVLTLEDVKSILPDIGINDPNAQPFKPFLLEAVRQAGDAADPRLREAARLLEAWDNHAVDGSVAKTLFDAWMRELRGAIFNDEIGAAMAPPDIERALQPSLILHVLEGKKASVPLSRDYMNGKSAAEVCLEALKKALDRLTQERGPQMSLWTYQQPRTRFSPLPDIPAYSRGTYLFIAELAKPQIRSESVLPPGQSEDPASPHFGDQRELASWWLYKPLITDREALEKLVPPAADGGK
jgi:penicillin amidase